MTTSVASAARELAKIFGFNCKPEDNCAECPHHLKEAAELLAAYATSERSRVIAELAEKVDEFAKGAPSTFGPAPSRYDWQTFAAWLRSQEVK